MKNSRRAFTLIELLVVTAILAVISLAIYSLINNGLKIWQRVNQRIIEEDLDIFFEKFAHDLRNCAKFSGVKFIGTPERLEFATIVNSPTLHRNTIGQILYVYDQETKQLERIQRDYSQIYSAEEGLAQPPLSNLKLFKFFYYIQNENSKERVWVQESPVDRVPLAVRIELQLTYGTETSKFTRTVSIPVGG
ncbi:MAG: prepilin-type N-terminal cleavage/methylation domain-containing protein [Candidatus Omnitrophica bacterium]|nr:prepilin-type N-terminal cleavage/methylation domain-containing protein [Candidatus Omnitrophota bacterium]